MKQPSSPGELEYGQAVMKDHTALYDKLEDLADLEIAILLCLVAEEQGLLVDTDPENLDDLGSELSLILHTTFGLSSIVLNCSARTSLGDFNNAIFTFDEARPARPMLSLSNSEPGSRHEPFPFNNNISSKEKLKTRSRWSHLHDRKIPNVIIAKDFDRTPEEVQLQALQLIRMNQISIKSALHNTPKPFLFIPLLGTSRAPLSARLNWHLNDHIFLSHFHDIASQYEFSEDTSSFVSDDASFASVVRPFSYASQTLQPPHPIFDEEIQELRRLNDAVTSSADTTCYLQNFVVFLRLNRGVYGGISALATRHLQLLVRCLASFQGLDFLVPSLVVIAAKKIYRHRIIIACPEDDRSLLYGSNLYATRHELNGLTAEKIIDNVLAEVEAPL